MRVLHGFLAALFLATTGGQLINVFEEVSKLSLRQHQAPPIFYTADNRADIDTSAERRVEVCQKISPLARSFPVGSELDLELVNQVARDAICLPEVIKASLSKTLESGCLEWENTSVHANVQRFHFGDSSLQHAGTASLYPDLQLVTIAIQHTLTDEDINFDPAALTISTDGFALCHSRLHDVAAEIYPNLKQLVQESLPDLRSYELIFTGWDAGGTIAGILARMLYHDIELPFKCFGGPKNKMNQIKTITFGAPQSARAKVSGFDKNFKPENELRFVVFADQRAMSLPIMGPSHTLTVPVSSRRALKQLDKMLDPQEVAGDKAKAARLRAEIRKLMPTMLTTSIALPYDVIEAIHDPFVYFSLAGYAFKKARSSAFAIPSLSPEQLNMLQHSMTPIPFEFVPPLDDEYSKQLEAAHKLSRQQVLALPSAKAEPDFTFDEIDWTEYFGDFLDVDESKLGSRLRKAARDVAKATENMVQTQAAPDPDLSSIYAELDREFSKPYEASQDQARLNQASIGVAKSLGQLVQTEAAPDFGDIYRDMAEGFEQGAADTGDASRLRKAAVDVAGQFGPLFQTEQALPHSDLADIQAEFDRGISEPAEPALGQGLRRAGVGVAENLGRMFEASQFPQQAISDVAQDFDRQMAELALSPDHEDNSARLRTAAKAVAGSVGEMVGDSRANESPRAAPRGNVAKAWRKGGQWLDPSAKSSRHYQGADQHRATHSTAQAA